MRVARSVATLIGLAIVGMVLGALAGFVTTAAGMAALALRNGLKWPFGTIVFWLGAAIGGGLGTVLAPVVAFTAWRYVPIGRLFANLTLGTIIGGCAVALIFPNPIAALLGGVVGFSVAGDRLARRSNMTQQVEHAPNTNSAS